MIAIAKPDSDPTPAQAAMPTYDGPWSSVTFGLIDVGIDINTQTEWPAGSFHGLTAIRDVAQKTLEDHIAFVHNVMQVQSAFGWKLLAVVVAGRPCFRIVAPCEPDKMRTILERFEPGFSFEVRDELTA